MTIALDPSGNYMYQQLQYYETLRFDTWRSCTRVARLSVILTTNTGCFPNMPNIFFCIMNTKRAFCEVGSEFT
jgi:hypothetical protein